MQIVTHHLSAFFLVLSATVARACTDVGAGELPLRTRVQYSDVVVYGKVRRQLPDTKYGYGLPNLFVAEFNVYCTYKGGPISQVINITGAGHVPGLCHHTRLKVGNKYIVLLTNEGDNFEPRFRDIEVKDDESVAKLSQICDLELDYPSGIQSVSPIVQCPDPKPAEECVANVPTHKGPTAHPRFGEVKQTTKSTANAMTATCSTAFIVSLLISLT